MCLPVHYCSQLFKCSDLHIVQSISGNTAKTSRRDVVVNGSPDQKVAQGGRRTGADPEEGLLLSASAPPVISMPSPCSLSSSVLWVSFHLPPSLPTPPSLSAIRMTCFRKAKNRQGPGRRRLSSSVTAFKLCPIVAECFLGWERGDEYRMAGKRRSPPGFEFWLHLWRLGKVASSLQLGFFDCKVGNNNTACFVGLLEVG